MATLSQIVVDSTRPSALARFWAEVLDEYEVRAYDAAEIARLAARGLTPETDPAVALDGPELTIFFQQTAEPKRARNRVHVDVVSSDRPREIARLVALGATVRDEHDGFSVLLDPEGNEFCVTDPRD